MPDIRLRLTGPGAGGARVAARLLQATLDVLVEAVEGSVRLRAEGRSRARGSKPGWLERAAAFDVELAEGSTVLLLEAPPLAQVCPEIFAQPDLFEPLHGNPSSVVVFAESFADVVSENRDSDLYDDELLETLLKFGRVFREGVEAVELLDGRTLSFTSNDLDRVQDLRRSMPADQRVRLSGTLDALRHSSRTFEIALAEGERVRGVLATDAGEIAKIGSRLGGAISVEGTAKFRASGRLLRLDADWISPADGDQQLWSKAPRPVFATLQPSELRSPQGPRSGVGAIFGQWPGEESDEEIEALLREIS